MGIMVWLLLFLALPIIERQNFKVEKNEALKEIVDRYKHLEGPLIPILQETQDLYGYIPHSAQVFIANELKMPLSDIYGIITFYSRFTLAPKGKYCIFVCMGTACYVKGAEEVLAAVKNCLGVNPKETTADGLFSIEETRCIGACGLAPIVKINEDIYAKVKPGEVEEILAKYRDEGEKLGCV